MADELPQWKRPPKRRQRRPRQSAGTFALAPRRPQIAVSAAIEAQIAARFAQLQADRPLQGFRAFLRLAGLYSAHRRGVVGSRDFGWWLHGHRGGNAIRAHRYRRSERGSIPGYPTLRPWLKSPQPPDNTEQSGI